MTLPTLPEALQTQIASYLSRGERISLAPCSKACRTAVNQALLDDYRRIIALPFLANLTLKQSMIFTAEGYRELVKRVTVLAAEHINQNSHLFTNEDRARLHLPIGTKAVGFSYAKMSATHELIQLRQNEINLSILFGKILPRLVALNVENLPVLTNNSTINAGRIWLWMIENPQTLDRVTELAFNRARITSLPPEINLLLNLQVVDLEGISIKALPENFNPRNLQVLFLQNTGIRALPENFNPPNLQRLYLYGTQIIALPENFNPPNLQELHFAYTEITALPAGFNTQNLRMLNLTGSRISALPEGFNPQNLQDLVLTATKIAALPENFNPQNLRELYLVGTEIAALPAGFNPPNLQELHFKGSKIVTLPEGFNPPLMTRDQWHRIHLDLKENRRRQGIPV